MSRPRVRIGTLMLLVVIAALAIRECQVHLMRARLTALHDLLKYQWEVARQMRAEKERHDREFHPIVSNYSHPSRP